MKFKHGLAFLDKLPVLKNTDDANESHGIPPL